MKKIVFIIALIMALIVVVPAFATAVPKITWCHTEPNGNSQTLELPAQALQNAGHMDASGNPLHAGDHAGACVEVTPTVTVTPTDDPTPTPTIVIDCGRECDQITPTPTITVTPTPDDPGGSDGKSDGKSDGSCSKPPCYTNLSGRSLLPASQAPK